MAKKEMSDTIRYCYIDILRDSLKLKSLVKCGCNICKFRRLYQVNK